MKLKVSIVGFGYTGKQICSLLLQHTRHSLEINILDPDLQVKGAFNDLEHAAELNNLHQLTFNQKEDFYEADFIFHCAGGRVPKGASRLEICAESAKITRDIFEGINFKKEPFILIVANPVELITSLTQSITRLPKHKVFGTGTMLDSVRMNHLINKENSSFGKVNAILLGEHGSTSFVSRQLSSIDNQPLVEKIQENRLIELLEKVKKAADEIKQTQDATLYGVSFCAIKLFEAVYSEEVVQLAVSTFTPPIWSFLNKKNLALSLYADISQNGVFVSENYEPNKAERRLIQKSADQLSSCLKALDHH